MKKSFTLCMLSAMALGTSLCAQDAAEGFALTATGTVSGRSDVSRGSHTGTSDARSYGFKAEGAFASGIEGGRVRVGLNYSEVNFDFKDALFPLAEELTSLSLPVGYSQKIGAEWTALATLSPGWRSADGKYTKDAFSVPVMMGAMYAPSRSLQCMFGVVYDPFNEYKVLPAGGVSWAFDPQWRVSVGFPKTGLTYSFSRELSLSWTVSMEGGSYWVKETPMILTVQVEGVDPVPYFRDTYLSYREVRTGLELEYRTGPLVGFKVSGGPVLDRKWDYHEKDVQYDGDMTWYGSVSVSLRF